MNTAQKLRTDMESVTIFNDKGTWKSLDIVFHELKGYLKALDEYRDELKNEMFGYEFDKSICSNEHCRNHENSINKRIDKIHKELRG